MKLDFFFKWRLGGLRARFWRPRASIFEGLWVCRAGFWRASGACFDMPFAALRIATRLDCRRSPCLDVLDQCALYNALSPHSFSPTIFFAPSGAAVCAQHIRRLPKGVRACRIQGQSFQVHSLKALPRLQAKDSCQVAFPPSFFLPPRAAQTAAATPNHHLKSFWRLFFDFLRFQIAF